MCLDIYVYESSKVSASVINLSDLPVVGQAPSVPMPPSATSLKSGDYTWKYEGMSVFSGSCHGIWTNMSIPARSKLISYIYK